MLGIPGELVLVSKVDDDIVSLVKEYEVNLNLNRLPDPFIIKKIGIKVDADCTVKINGRDFIINKGEVLEFGYDTTDIKTAVLLTEGVNVVVRYLY